MLPYTPLSKRAEVFNEEPIKSLEVIHEGVDFGGLVVEVVCDTVLRCLRWEGQFDGSNVLEV